MSLNNPNIDYQKKLIKIAVDVDSYIVNIPPALQKFRDMIKPLANRWVYYQKAVLKREKDLLAHWELVKKNPKLQDKKAGPPKEGWEWSERYLYHLPDETIQHPVYYMPAKLAPVYLKNIKAYIDRNNKKLTKLQKNSAEYNNLKGIIAEQEHKHKQVQSKYDGLTKKQRDTERFFVEGVWFQVVYTPEEANEKVFGCWRPPLKSRPKNPLYILRPFGEEDRYKPLDEEYRSKPKELQTLPELEGEAVKERFYILLSAVHDNCLPEVQHITNDIWSDDLKENVWHFFDECFGDKIALLTAAFERVKADLPEKPAETGQENKGTKRKCEKFKNFCLIIYEKTMKSFFDSITGR